MSTTIICMNELDRFRETKNSRDRDITVTRYANGKNNFSFQISIYNTGTTEGQRICLSRTQARIFAESILRGIDEMKEKTATIGNGGIEESVTPVPPAIQAAIEQTLREKGLIN